MTSAAAPGRSVTARVPAKVNLELLVGPRRADGYHPLSTVFQAVQLYDEVTVEPADDWGVTVTGPYADLVPVDGTNLALRAARGLAEVGRRRRAGAHQDPQGHPGRGRHGRRVGRRGGALVACDALWGLASPRTVLEDLAAELGSDVPFGLPGGTAMGSGRGEQLAPVLGPRPLPLGLRPQRRRPVHPDGLCRVRPAARAAPVPEPSPSAPMMTALRSGDADALGRALTNDLQEAALSLQPGLGDVLDAGLECGALGGVVSGSGPTVAFLVADHEAALDLAVALTASGCGPLGQARDRTGRGRPRPDRRRRHRCRRRGRRRRRRPAARVPRAAGGRRWRRPRPTARAGRSPPAPPERHPTASTAHHPTDPGAAEPSWPTSSPSSARPSPSAPPSSSTRSRSASAPASRIGVVGRNGGGKSTLLRVLAGRAGGRRRPGDPLGGLTVGHADARTTRSTPPPRSARRCSATCPSTSGPATRGSVTSSPGCSAASTPRPSAASTRSSARCPAASAGGWRSPGCSSPTPTCCCSTSRPTTSTSRASPGWPTTW